jgi:hypothetical protein
MMGEKASSWDLIRLLFIMPLPDTYPSLPPKTYQNRYRSSRRE